MKIDQDHATSMTYLSSILASEVNMSWQHS